MPNLNKLLPPLILSLSLLLIASSAISSEITKSKKYLGTDWQLTSVDNQQIRLSEFKGQPVILVFWATWCPYCKKLLPGMQTLHDKYKNKGLKIIAVNIKEDWKPKVYWRNHEYTFDAVLEGDKLANVYGVTGTPTVVFIEPSGKVAKVTQFSDPAHPSLEKFANFYTRKLHLKN
ncbi:peroxiredoxin family protein [Paraglaciecola sp.]|uniref:peroxiredoxin family protein n=1 Tax=Paraglaciecola sp. TaxID=1920173 RepID=UPI003EF950B2